MSLLLHLETATKVCSVALSENGHLIALHEIADDQYAHGEQLTLLIEKVLSEASKKPADLMGVSVTSGPGSYTGLRIGVSTAKGLCYALNIPLLSVDALTSMMQLAKQKYPGSRLCPMIDARRMEVYSTIFETDGTILKPMGADVLDAESYAEFEPFVYFGDGAAKMTETWAATNKQFDAELRCSAAGQVALAYKKWQDKEFEDVAYFEPLYLKEFVGTTPRKK